MERKCDTSNRRPVMRVKYRRRLGCIRLFVCPTTGGRLDITVSPRETILGLKAVLARRLRVSPSRITLIYKDKVLRDGCIQDHRIPDQSHVTLLPNMESGLSLHQADKNIMQALENLTETQVSDFLSGRSPLMLAIHMGENTVFVQLQLSVLQSQSQSQLLSQSRSQSQLPSQSQSCPSLSSVTPAAASVLSRMGLSPSTTIAEATRSLSQRLQRLHGTSAGSSLQAPASGPPALQVHQPTATQSPTSQQATAALSQGAALPPKVFQLPKKQPHANLTMSSVSTPPSSSGAVIDSLKHLGQGVYTGTFQGTLDPSLQDGNGQPRRSVSTILHILNDLLVAAPRSPAQIQGQEQAVVRSEDRYPGLASSQPLTPPSTSKGKSNPVVPSLEDEETTMLRMKMQRVQMMLAQRKEQRRTRREVNAPYSNQRSPQKMTPADVSAPMFVSSARSVCMAAAATAAENADGAKHGESSNDPSSAYCKPNIEQDSLAV